MQRYEHVSKISLADAVAQLDNEKVISAGKETRVTGRVTK